MLKNVIKTICILSFLLIINFNKINEVNYSIKTNEIINQEKELNNTILDHISINNYNLLIKSGNEKDVLDSNLVYMMDNSILNNIFLAGHNSNIVFHRIYDLNVNDEVILYLNNNKYVYYVYSAKYINVDNYSIYKSETFNKLTLITCSKNNQKRYVVICKLK